MERVTEIAGTAVENVSSPRMPIAEALEGSAATEPLTGNDDFTIKTAQMVGTTAGYLRSHDAQEMMCDAEQVARQNPLPSLIGAAALGFLIGAFLRRS